MRPPARLAPVLLAALLAALPRPALAGQAVTVTVIEEVVEEAVPAVGGEGGSDRFVAAAARAPNPRGIAAFGPFRVLDDNRAALVDATDERSPAAFAAMLKAHPGIRLLELVECPGTDDDRANLALGRMIHARGLSTHVPDGGSVRSGAVELFLAGVTHKAEPGAEFAVHSWADEDGHEPSDFPMSAPENRIYLDYYREMGMSAAEARAFYDMTNSVPNAQARWLSAGQMAQWVRYN
ncbi:alpha/beta hydrolase [Novosphingobium flavum]|uniref:Alpha/beta hydrolase n=1 Tax=Novosphingobium flavum TaxID=1778672 RepID=A0A7X1FU70_9SPHN|nr:alpha/beta hydrolase [Novosphingobium flavum]MBC2666909.1 alpha/beta hydrolase [Novosphingobium flavum]